MTQTYDIAIVGAGPAGIMAGIFASRNGKKVVLLEKNEQIGRKILATGNGRCNLTNANISIDRYYTSDEDFVSNILRQFDQNETIKFFESLGLILKEEDRGRIFPRTNQASSVVEVLRQELDRAGVEILTNFTVKHIEHSDVFARRSASDEAIYDIRLPLPPTCLPVGMGRDRNDKIWNISSANGEVIKANKIIITTGGKAAHHLGSSGDGLFWMQKLGHTISPIYAALVPVETIEEWPKEVQGVKVEAKVSVEFDKKIISESFGDLLFTHFGVSGPAIMSQAGKIAPLLEKGAVCLKIDIFPESDSQVLDQKLANIFASAGAKAVKNSLVGIAPANLLPIILRNANVSPDKKAAEVSKIERQNIVENIKNIKLTVKKIRPLKEAQVTSGGIELTEVNVDTLESKIVPDLYFAGEILDVDGDSGGFNLQWAWSSGFVAGTNSSG